MFVKSKSFPAVKIETDISGFIKLLKENGLLNKKGEAKERIEVFLGGSFFNKSKKNNPADNYAWVFSTFDFDREDERIDVKGWELENYLKNPVVLWSHDTRIPAIGFSKEIGVKDNKLRGNIIFNNKEIDPFGWSIGKRVASGAIRAGSVGFIVKKVELIEEAGKENLIFRNQELLEFSICNVPSNPFALVQNSKIFKEVLPIDYKETLLPEDESEEGLREFWKGLIKSGAGGVF